MTWVEGKRLLSGEKIMVPAQIALPFFLPHKEEELIGYFTTGGLAAHINYQEAIYHGVLELFERDAVNLRWNCRLAPERIILDGNYRNLKLARLLKIAEGLPVDLKFYGHRNGFDELSVVSTLGYAPGFGKYGYAAGGGVSFDIEETMLGALSEFGQSEGTLRFLSLAKDWELAQATRRIFHVEEGVKISEIDHFFKVLTYYGYAGNFAKLGWYMNEGKSVSIDTFPRQTDGSLAARYTSMLSLLHKYRIDPIVIDLSPPQMTQMRLVKILIPDLAPPYVQNLPMLGSERYYEGPRSIGTADRRLDYAELFTADPQPYP
jgi:ribosomal protein S12 methylthiotransferase accessory factor